VTLTFDLAPEAAARLAQRAEREGRDPNELAADLLGDTLADDDDAIDAWLRGPVTNTLDKIEAGNGRFYTVREVEEYLAQRRASA
jgi:predicted transcriptional regulator